MLKEKINLKVILISLIFALFSILTDNVFFDMNMIETDHYVKLKVIYIIIVMCIGQLICKMVKEIRRKNHVREAVRFSLICAGILGFFLLLTYPGIWLWDNMEMINLASVMQLSGWHGFYMQCFFVFCLMAIPFPVGINIVQIIIISAVMGRIFYIISSILHKRKLAYILVLFLLLPANLYWSLMAYRTAFFGFFFALTVLEFINFWQNKNINLLYSILLFGFTWNIRSEGYGLLVFIPLIAYKLYKCEMKKKGIAFLTYTVLMVVLVSVPVPSDRSYLASAILNPLECMMKSDLNSDDLQRDLERIDKVFNVETMQSAVASPMAANVDGAAWYAEGFWDKVYCPKNEWVDMLKAYCNLVYFNPQLFFKFRMQTMYQSINSNKSTISEIDRLINSEEGIFEFDSYIGARPISENVRQTVRKIIGFEYGGKMIYTVGSLLGSAIIPCLVLIVLLAYGVFCHRKELWLSGVCVLITIIIVFMTAPAANSMYYFSLYNSMYLLLFMYMIKKIDKCTK